VSEREWTFYWDADGEPWAIFLDGHDHDLRTLKSVTVKNEIRQAWLDGGMDDDNYFSGNLNIGRWWIRDTTDDEDCEDPEHSWQWCTKDAPGARPITGAKFS
jgi:hypothetical protein